MSSTLRTVTFVALALAFVCLPVTLAADKSPIKYVGAKAVCSLDGKVLYDAYCAVCHGKDGRGDGPAAKFLSEPIPDLRLLAANNGGRFDTTGVQLSIEGKYDTHEAMPGWGKVLQANFVDPLLTTRSLTRHVATLQVSHPQ